MKKIYLKAFCLFAAMYGAAVSAHAQIANATSALSTTHSTLKGLASTFLNIVSVIMGFVGAAMLAINLSKYAKGDPSSSDSLMKVGGGLLIAVIILQVIRAVFLS